MYPPPTLIVNSIMVRHVPVATLHDSGVHAALNSKRLTVIIIAGLRQLSLQIQSSSPIMAVKQEIQQRIHLSMSEQFLIFEGKVLDGPKSIVHYGIQDFSSLRLSQVMRGGRKNTKALSTVRKTSQSILMKFFETKAKHTPLVNVPVGDLIQAQTRKVRTKETFHLPIPKDYEEETTSKDETPLCNIPAYMKFGDKDWLGNEVIDCFLNSMINKHFTTIYLPCSIYTILTLRTIDALLHENFDGQVTHPASWNRAVLPLGVQNSRGETSHWCLVLIESEYRTLTLFEPIENMRNKRKKEMQKL